MAAAEGYEHDLVPIETVAVPTAVLADKGSAAVLLRKAVGGVECSPNGATCELNA
jgi:hypothetical protein